MRKFYFGILFIGFFSTNEFVVAQTILIDSSIDSVHQTKTKDEVSSFVNKQEQSVLEVRSKTQDYLNVDKFKHLKIDTGNVALNKDGLLLQGRQFLNKNDLSGNKLRIGKLSAEDNHDLKAIKNRTIDGQVINISTDKKRQKDLEAKKAKIDNAIRLLNDQGLSNNGNISLDNSKVILSEKHKQALYDSLGLEKADSIFNVIKPFAKRELSKEELLAALNSNLQEQKSERLNTKDKESDFARLTNNKSQIDNTDLSKIQLPLEMSQLPPIGGRQISEKYSHLVDSLQKLRLKKEKIVLKEEDLTDNVKDAVVKKQENFWDRSYIEGIVGFLQTKEFTLIQLAPAFGFHLNQYLSLGIGPSILGKIYDKKLSFTVGVRSFAKVELFNRRIYFQIEDNLNSGQANSETIQTRKHNVLVGGGVLLPITKSLALNPSVMYILNGGSSNNVNGSPWVVRLGISSIRKKDKLMLRFIVIINLSFTVLFFELNAQATVIRKKPHFYIDINKSNKGHVYDIQADALSFQYYDGYGTNDKILLEIYDWKHNLVSEFTLAKIYGLNYFNMDLKQVYGGWIINDHYTCELTDEVGRKYQLTFKIIPPPLKKDPEVNILVNPIAINCGQITGNLIEFYGQITGGKAPYSIDWFVLNNQKSDFLYQPRSEELAIAGKSVVIEVDKAMDYYVLLKVKDACGSVQQKMVHMSCMDKQDKINTVFVEPLNINTLPNGN